MDLRILIIFPIILASAYGLVIKPGHCLPQNGVKGSFSKMDGPVWRKCLDGDPPPGITCCSATFQTFPNDTTNIHRKYMDTSTKMWVNVDGTLQNNKKTGEFSVALTGYPPQAQYWLLDHWSKGATIYICMQYNATHTAESAFLLVPKIGIESDRIVSARARFFLSKAGYSFSNLQAVDNSKCPS